MAPIPQQVRNCFDHRIFAFDYSAQPTLARRLFRISAVGDKRDRSGRHNRPTVVTRKTGYICYIGRLCHDKTMQLGPRDTVADAFEPSSKCVAIHIAQYLQLPGKIKFFLSASGVLFLYLARGQASH
jgi:hypothetical protein